jgi:hypothetical protein
VTLLAPIFLYHYKVNKISTGRAKEVAIAWQRVEKER